MPPPPQSSNVPPMLVDANGKAKRKRLTGVTMFMRDFKASRPDLRALPMSSMQLISAASEAFDCLSLEKQREYEQLAKMENKRYDKLYGDEFRRDCEGVYLSERDQTAKHRTEYDAYANELVAGLATRVDSLGDMLATEFVVGEVFDYIDADEMHDKGAYVPAEFGFVRFSLTGGVLAHLHCIVAPRDKTIPVYLTSQCKEQSADTHQISSNNCPYAEASLARFCIGLKTLCSPELPIFVPEEHLAQMQKALKYAYDDPAFCDRGCPFVKRISRARETKVFPFEKLYTAILASECLPAHKRLRGFLEGQVSIELNRERFTGEEHACPLHREQDNLRYCALLRAHSHAWTLLKAAAEPYDIAITPDHGPKELDLPVPKPVKANWLSRGSRFAGGPARTSGSSGGGGGGGTAFHGGQSRQHQAPQQNRWRQPSTGASAAASVADSIDDLFDKEFDCLSVSDSIRATPLPQPPQQPRQADRPTLGSFAGSSSGGGGGGGTASYNANGAFGGGCDSGGGRGRGRGRQSGGGGAAKGVGGPPFIMD